MRVTAGHISMTRRAFVNEHTRLVRILQRRQLGGLSSEEREQSEELKKVKHTK